ncbi:hypothetical protein GCM10023155_09750 [Bremerella cremea]
MEWQQGFSEGEIMKQTLWMWTLMLLTAAAGAGCQHVGQQATGGYNLPPAQQLAHPGPGVGGPGPGVLAPPPIQPVSAMMPVGPGGIPPMPAPSFTSQVLFVSPDGMQVSWDIGGIGLYDSEPRIVPFSKNFPQGGIYRLKITNIEGQPGVELYPTLEVGFATPRTEAFLAHNAVPVQFTEDDFAQVRSGTYVTKVIYLPDPNYQELALANVETLVSTRLDPGVDPIVEADRRGTIMAIVRLGNKDLEVPGEELEGMMAGGMPMGMPAAGAAYCGPGPGTPPPPGMSAAMPNPYAVPYVAGVTVPSYGMPITGTPIGLPGPPHIPLGGPAGLQKHVIKNHTHTHIPGPTDKVALHVKQRPGISYPQPPNRAWITEENIHPSPNLAQPYGDMHQQVPPAGGYYDAAGQWCPTP